MLTMVAVIAHCGIAGTTNCEGALLFAAGFWKLVGKTVPSGGGKEFLHCQQCVCPAKLLARQEGQAILSGVAFDLVFILVVWFVLGRL